jgi:hypothetical protein
MEETLSLAPFRHILGRLENDEDQERKSWGLSGEIVLWPRSEGWPGQGWRLTASATAGGAPIIMDAGIDFL